MSHFTDGFEKRGGAYGHFVHTSGLTPSEKEKLHGYVSDTGTFRRGSIFSSTSGGGKFGGFGGKNNWAKDVVSMFHEKHPKSKDKVWVGKSTHYSDKHPDKTEVLHVTELPEKELPNKDFTNWRSHAYIHSHNTEKSGIAHMLRKIHKKRNMGNTYDV